MGKKCAKIAIKLGNVVNFGGVLKKLGCVIWCGFWGEMGKPMGGVTSMFITCLPSAPSLRSVVRICLGPNPGNHLLRFRDK